MQALLQLVVGAGNLFDSLMPETVQRQSPGSKYLHKWENNNARTTGMLMATAGDKMGLKNSENLKKASCRAYKLTKSPCLHFTVV